MSSTYLRTDAALRLRRGIPFALRDEIVRMEGTPRAGEPVHLKDESGGPLGIADVDLGAEVAVRRLGLPEEPAEGIIQRRLRAAAARRALWLEDTRYSRLVNDDGDGLPGLIVDRFDRHFVVQTLTRAMDARLDEIARSLLEVAGAGSVLLRNDSAARAAQRLPSRPPHVLLGAPPRWSRVLELGARMTFDLLMGTGTGYAYDERELKRLLGRTAPGARVLDVNCRLGGLFVQAGLHGARSILAGTPHPDEAELARENAEANGLGSRARVARVEPSAMLDGLSERFDLVLFRVPDAPAGAADQPDRLIAWVRAAVRATRRGGRLLLATGPTAHPGELGDPVALACALEGRAAVGLAALGPPPDFPHAVGSPSAPPFRALALELS